MPGKTKKSDVLARSVGEYPQFCQFFKSFCQEIILYCVSEKNPLPVMLKDVDGTVLSVFNREIRPTFRFVYDKERDMFVGIVTFFIKNRGDYQPLWLVLFDKEGKAYTSDSMAVAYGDLCEKRTVHFIMENVASRVLEQQELSVVYKGIMQQIDEGNQVG